MIVRQVWANQRNQLLLTIPKEEGIQEKDYVAIKKVDSPFEPKLKGDFIGYVDSLESNFDYIIKNIKDLRNSKEFRNLLKECYYRFYDFSGYERVMEDNSFEKKANELISSFSNINDRHLLIDILNVSFMLGRMKGFSDCKNNFSENK
jgi:hypothetical protein